MELFKTRVESWSAKLKTSTSKPYLYGLYRYCEFVKLEPDELIKEARQDYIDRVPPWEIRSAKHFEDFIQYLKKENIPNLTALTYLYGVKNFYKYNKVPLPEVEVNIPLQNTEEYRDLDIMKLEDIRKFVTSLSGFQKLLKALTLTFLSSAQSQKEVLKLKGKDLNPKNIVNGVLIVKMLREKRNVNCFYIINSEALQAIKEYKPNLKDEDYVFTQEDGKTKLGVPYVDTIFARHCEKLGFPRGYIAPHRFRHYFKTSLTGHMTSEYVEFLKGHRIKGTAGSYFDGNAKRDEILKEYLENQKYFVIYTEQETLQRQYNELVAKSGTIESLKEENGALKSTLESLQIEIERLKEAKGITENEDLKHKFQEDIETMRAEFEQKISKMETAYNNFMKFANADILKEMVDRANQVKA